MPVSEPERSKDALWSETHLLPKLYEYHLFVKISGAARSTGLVGFLALRFFRKRFSLSIVGLHRKKEMKPGWDVTSLSWIAKPEFPKTLHVAINVKPRTISVIGRLRPENVDIPYVEFKPCVKARVMVISPLISISMAGSRESNGGSSHQTSAAVSMKMNLAETTFAVIWYPR